MKAIHEKILGLALIVMSVSPLCRANDVKPYDLELRGNEVCKVGAYYPQPICYTRSWPEQDFSLPLTIDVTKRVKALMNLWPDNKVRSADPSVLRELGGAIFIKPNDRKKILKHFKGSPQNNFYFSCLVF
ncbi:MAG: hypothetical protein C5B49_07055 [Bdellovibrio sp.]|nr:MAG: hypothetical protein C5B49_07055 [Bdellovibrio sp.]